MKERNYGLDIARILAMLGIVTLHINGAGGYSILVKKANSNIGYSGLSK